MSGVVFPALVIYLLVLPGILFQRAYSSGGIWFWGKPRENLQKLAAAGHPRHPSSNRGFAEEIFKGLLTAVTLHVVWCVGVSLLTPFYVQIGLIGDMLAGRANAPSLDSQLDGKFGPWIVAYFVSQYAAAPLIGRLALGLVRHCKWDKRSRAFRFNDNWFYYFTGEILDLEEFVWADARKELSKRIQGIETEIITSHSGEAYIYRGLTENWSITDNGALEYVVLSNTRRSLLNPPAEVQTPIKAEGSSTDSDGVFPPPPAPLPPLTITNANGLVVVPERLTILKNEKIDSLELTYIGLQFLRREEKRPDEE